MPFCFEDETLTRCDSSGRRSQNQCATAGKEGNPACGRSPDPFCELCDFFLILSRMLARFVAGD